MTHVDTRKERPLTSREIAKIICGIIGGAIGAGVNPETLLVALKEQGHFLRGEDPTGPGTGSEIVDGVFDGLIGGLVRWCHSGDVRTAVDWTCEHWNFLVTNITDASA